MTIQRASYAALQGGFTLPWLLEELEKMQPPATRAAAADELPEPAARLWSRPAAGGRGPGRRGRLHHSRSPLRGECRHARRARSRRARAGADGHAGDSGGAAQDALRGEPGLRLRSHDDGHDRPQRRRAGRRARLHGSRARSVAGTGLRGLRHPQRRAGGPVQGSRGRRRRRLGAGRGARAPRGSGGVPAVRPSCAPAEVRTSRASLQVVDDQRAHVLQRVLFPGEAGRLAPQHATSASTAAPA